MIESLRSIFWSYDESGICHLPGSDGPLSTRSHCARTGAEESRDPGQRREARRRRDPHHERAGPEVLLFLPQDRREETDVAHLLPAYYARRMAADDQADGQPEQTADRTGGRARRFEIPLQQPRARSRRGSTGRLRSGKADDRLQILRQRHGTSLQQVPLDGPRHTPTPHQGRMGAAGRHAPGLLSALGFPGFPPPRPAPDRAWTGRASAGQPAPDGKSCRPSLERFPAQDRGVVRLVGKHAPAPASRTLGAFGIPVGQGARLRTGGDFSRCRRRGRVRHRNPLHLRAVRAAGGTRRKGPGLHRVSVARAFRGRRQ